MGRVRRRMGMRMAMMIAWLGNFLADDGGAAEQDGGFRVGRASVVHAQPYRITEMNLHQHPAREALWHLWKHAI